MAQRNILELGTGAANSAEFEVEYNSMSISNFGAGVDNTDTGVLQRKASNDDWDNVIDGGATVELDADQTIVIVEAPGTYRVVYAARTGNIGVDLQGVLT